MKDSLLFAEGFIGAAGSMVSETAIGAVDLTQIIGIASLFVGPAAVGKMAKGTKLGAKAAEMISLAKNSTKARILANVEKWGSKVDNILAKSNNVIGKFGEKLLDTRIPVGIRKEAVAFAGGMGTMPTFSVESKTLREVMHFSSKLADDVVRVAEKPFDKERILENIRQSRLARESSKFDDYLRTLSV